MKKIAISQGAVIMVAFLTVGTTIIALAQGPGHNPMTLMDLNKNGSVSLKELRNFRPDTTDEMFARWDTDDSGELEQEELMSAIREILANEAEQRNQSR